MREQRHKERQHPAPREVQRFRRSLLHWFVEQSRKFPWRKASASNYEHIIAEVLLQRTRAETVASFFPQFVQKYPSWKRLSTASVFRLQRLLQPIGLWRRRAVSIRALAQEMAKRRGHFPKDRDEIEALPGVGQYIANSVLLFQYGEAQPLLDVNMARVLERYFGPRRLADIRYDPYLQSLAQRVVRCSDPVSVNWSLLDLGALICKPSNPACNKCPHVMKCRYARTRAIN